jgi:ribonuclease BN (tRNA processing enzyme)
MKLRLLGTTGYHPTDDRHTACMMIPEHGLILDAGTSMFRARQFLTTNTLDIFLTHAHLDHVIGLTYLFDVLYARSMDYVRVHGEEDKLLALEQHLFHEALFPARPSFEWKPLSGSVPLSGNGTLTHFPLEHPGGTVGYRLDWPGHSLAYVTDTTAHDNASYISQIRDVDLLIHECYFADGWEPFAQKTGHSCTTPVAQVARLANAGRLILVHINPLDPSADPVGLEVARKIFPNTEMGQDLMEIEF